MDYLAVVIPETIWRPTKLWWPPSARGAGRALFLKRKRVWKAKPSVSQTPPLAFHEWIGCAWRYGPETCRCQTEGAEIGIQSRRVILWALQIGPMLDARPRSEGHE
jgi:hypothetical protein